MLSGAAFFGTAVPGELDVTVAGCATHITATRLTEGARGPRIRVHAAPVDPSATRQILTFQSVDAGLGIVGTSVTRCAGQAPYVDVPDPADASEVTLRGPVITVRGPWQLRVPMGELSDR
jgi:hypothetical protein